MSKPIKPPPMCQCGHWGYEHGMLDACCVVGCDCARFRDEERFGPKDEDE